MHQLKPGIDLNAFFKQVQKCHGDVHFATPDGDNLNLKSQLSHYVIMIVANNNDFLLHGNICCSDITDYDIIKDYVVEV